MRKAAQIILLLLILGLAGLGLFCFGATIMPLWIPLGFALLMSAALLPVTSRLMRRLTGSDSKIIKALAHMAVFTVLFFDIVVCPNYFVARPGTSRTENCVIESKYTKEHTRYRRAGRRTRIPDGTYNTWHMSLRLPDGRCKDVEVSMSTYRRHKKGGSYAVCCYDGLFGYTVVKGAPGGDADRRP